LEEAENLLFKFADKLEYDDWRSRKPGKSLVHDHLLDDLNTPAAISELARVANTIKGSELYDLRGELDFALQQLGFCSLLGASQMAMKMVAIEEFGDNELAEKIEQRLALIADQNWAEADRIRDKLLEQGIQLKDSKDPETGERITTWEVKR